MLVKKMIIKIKKIKKKRKVKILRKIKIKLKKQNYYYVLVQNMSMIKKMEY
jgi:cobalamin biosynthesis Co2+ chelatase CbiK